MSMDDKRRHEFVLMVGNRLRILREKSGLTQTQLADRVGVSQSLIAQIESGKKRLYVDLLYDIVNVLLVPPTYLLEDGSDIVRHSDDQKIKALEQQVASLTHDVQQLQRCLIEISSRSVKSSGIVRSVRKTNIPDG